MTDLNLTLIALIFFHSILWITSTNHILFVYCRKYYFSWISGLLTSAIAATVHGVIIPTLHAYHPMTYAESCDPYDLSQYGPIFIEHEMMIGAASGVVIVYLFIIITYWIYSHFYNRQEKVT